MWSSYACLTCLTLIFCLERRKRQKGWVQFDFLSHALLNAMFVYTQEWEAWIMLNPKECSYELFSFLRLLFAINRYDWRLEEPFHRQSEWNIWPNLPEGDEGLPCVFCLGHQRYWENYCITIETLFLNCFIYLNL